MEHRGNVKRIIQRIRRKDESVKARLKVPYSETLTFSSMATSSQRSGGDQFVFSSTDDNAIMKNILTTHFPDETTDIDVIPLLQIIKDVMHRAHPDASHHGTQVELDAIEDSVMYNGVMLEAIALTINRVSCEISCKCIGGGDAHTTTTGIFNMLSIFGWETKVVIALAAFAVNYGEFWLVAQANPLAKSVAHLKQLPDVLERGESLKPRFNNVTKLIKTMLDLTHCIIKFKQLPVQYLSPDTPELVEATTHIPITAYWIIRSIVSCTSTLVNNIGMEKHDMTTAAAMDLSSLAHKLSNIHDYLKHQLLHCQRLIDDKKYIEEYLTLIRFMETPHDDNTKSLKRLICLKDDQLPLYEGSTKKQVSINILRKKIVLLLVSDLDLPLEEMIILDQMYREAMQDPTRPESQFEVVWLPLVPNQMTTLWTEENKIKFEELRNMMPWYSVFHPSLLDPTVIKYIKEVWHFKKKPLLMVMDYQGKIVNTNALHMMWIWGSIAFPFTSLREEALWREETWRIELLADSIEPMIFNWVAEGKYICLYGGEDMEWIRKFTTIAQTVARQAGILLEMLYVGKSNPREKVRKNNEIIRCENLSYVLPDLTLIWFFWVRLESMLISKLQHTKSFDTLATDQIIKWISELLTYDGNDQSWAVINRGSNGEMIRAEGDTLLRSFTNYDEWRGKAQEKGFLPALKDHLAAQRQTHHCNRLILSGTQASEKERMVCLQCGRELFLYPCSVQ